MDDGDGIPVFQIIERLRFSATTREAAAGPSCSGIEQPSPPVPKCHEAPRVNLAPLARMAEEILLGAASELIEEIVITIIKEPNSVISQPTPLATTEEDTPSEASSSRPVPRLTTPTASKPRTSSKRGTHCRPVKVDGKSLTLRVNFPFYVPPPLTLMCLLADRDLFEALRCLAAEIKASIGDFIKGKGK